MSNHFRTSLTVERWGHGLWQEQALLHTHNYVNIVCQYVSYCSRVLTLQGQPGWWAGVMGCWWEGGSVEGERAEALRVSPSNSRHLYYQSQHPDLRQGRGRAMSD